MNEELKSEYKNPSVNASKVIPVTSHTGQETGTLQVTHQEFCLTSLKIYCHPFIFLLRECTCRSKVAFARTHTDSYSRFMHVLMANIPLTFQFSIQWIHGMNNFLVVTYLSSSFQKKPCNTSKSWHIDDTNWRKSFKIKKSQRMNVVHILSLVYKSNKWFLTP